MSGSGSGFTLEVMLKKEESCWSGFAVRLDQWVEVSWQHSPHHHPHLQYLHCPPDLLLQTPQTHHQFQICKECLSLVDASKYLLIITWISAGAHCSSYCWNTGWSLWRRRISCPVDWDTWHKEFHSLNHDSWVCQTNHHYSQSLTHLNLPAPAVRYRGQHDGGGARGGGGGGGGGVHPAWCGLVGRRRRLVRWVWFKQVSRQSAIVCVVSWDKNSWLCKEEDNWSDLSSWKSLDTALLQQSDW